MSGFVSPLAIRLRISVWRGRGWGLADQRRGCARSPPTPVCWLFVHNEYRFTKPGHPLFAGRLDNIRFRNVRGVSAMPRSVRGNGVAKPFGLEFVDCSVEERKSALDDANEREFFLCDGCGLRMDLKCRF